jgi:hypothetical protein
VTHLHEKERKGVGQKGEECLERVGGADLGLAQDVEKIWISLMGLIGSEVKRT